MAAEGRLVVGRDAELAALDAFLDGTKTRAFLVRGGPGVGKTTLWQDGVAGAERHGMRALVAKPSEAESPLALAALADLLADVEDAILAALPAPQAHALEVALLRREGDGRSPEPRAIAAGLLGVCRMLATSEPVLIAIDDVHWLDAATSAALSFVARRLSDERVKFLLSQRNETSSPLVQALGAEHVLTIDLHGLSFGAIRTILAKRLGATPPRRLLWRLYEATDGNPLFAVETARLLKERGYPETAAALPVPTDVQTLVRERISALPPSTREVLLAAALLAKPERGTLEATCEGDVATALLAAERAGIAALRDESVQFSHPLHAAGVVAATDERERRRMHRRLAEHAPDVEERARQLAAGAETQDEEAARVLEAGAAAARARGALHTAAELLERASDLTPPAVTPSRLARRIAAAELAAHAGDPAHGRALLEAVLSESPPPALRAEALRLIAEICISEEDPLEAERLLLEARSLAEDPRSRARIELELVYVIHFSFDFERGAEHGRHALALVEGLDDEALLAEALAYCAIGEYLAGEGVDWVKVERSLELEDPDRISLPGLPPCGVAAALMMYVGRHSSARELMSATCSRLSDRGQEKDLAHALLWSSWLETRSGNFERAAALADDSIACASVSGNRVIARWAEAQRAWVDAHLGREADARRRIAVALESGGERNTHVVLWSATTLALLEMSLADHDAAWQACEPLVRAVEAKGIGEPVGLMFLPDAIEALIGLGDLERAEGLLSPLQQRAQTLDRIWALATAARCRGLWFAAAGDVDSALSSFDEALRAHERGDLPFDRARALFSLGVVQRRARRRAEARATLRQATSEFERLGATLWASRARSELERISGKKPTEAGKLTPSELRAAELAARGLSNKEIAATLVVSVHTVEVHLSHAYRKLGVRSRSQLAEALVRPGSSLVKD